MSDRRHFVLQNLRRRFRAGGVSEGRVYYLLPLSSKHTLQDVHYDEQ